MRALHAVLPCLMSSFRPRHLWYGPSDVSYSALLAEGPSFFCPSHTWLGRVTPCVFCAPDVAGWAAHVIHLRTQRFCFDSGRAGTPLHVPLLGLEE